jgi:pimeloyl-ACP methyl ester carboxylesterase
MKYRQLLTSAFILCAAATAHASDAMFDSKGVKLHYTVDGKGEPVVLIHGFASSAAINWRLPGTIGLLAKNYQVIAFDVRGHGQSDKPVDESAYGLELVEDLIRLMDHLEIKKAHIAGYSMGGMIAMKFLALHQDRVLSGVVGGMGWLREGGMLKQVFAQAHMRPDAKAASACFRSLAQLALTEAELKRISVPVEILVGDQDPVRALYVIPLQQVRKDWPVIEIAGAGHLNCIAKPQFEQGILSWINQHA